jgi:hypothetical protein
MPQDELLCKDCNRVIKTTDKKGIAQCVRLRHKLVANRTFEDCLVSDMDNSFLIPYEHPSFNGQITLQTFIIHPKTDNVPRGKINGYFCTPIWSETLEKCRKIVSYKLFGNRDLIDAETFKTIVDKALSTNMFSDRGSNKQLHFLDSNIADQLGLTSTKYVTCVTPQILEKFIVSESELILHMKKSVGNVRSY